MGAPFTPGPWVADEFCEERDHCTRIGTTDGSPTYYHRTTTIAYCQVTLDEDDGWTAGARRVGVVEAEANARLIAAAPDLLEAAQEVMALLEEHGPAIVAHLLDTDDNAGERLRAAIAKATGEPAQ